MAASAVIQASAVGVNAVPGGLSSMIDNPAEITELTLSGAIDARDIFFIADEMPALHTLDLSAVSIEPYEGAPLKQLMRYEGNEIPAGAFAGSQLGSVKLGRANGAEPVALRIGNGAFAGTQLESIDIPSGCIIGEGAFASCRRLVSANIAADAVSAGAFAACDALESVAAPSVKVVGEYAFTECVSLSDVRLGASLSEIGRNAFAGCTSLGAFTFPQSLVAVGASAFCRSGLVAADLSSCRNLPELGDWAFSQCGQLAEVKLPASVASLGEGSFFECASLVSVNMPVACAVINPYVLKGVAGVDAGELIGEGVSEIGDYAFSGNTATSAMVLPSSLERIGDRAMAGMTGLADINAEQLDIVPELGRNVWAGVDQPSVTLRVLDAMYSAFATADQWKNFTVINTTSESDIMLSPRNKVRGCFDGHELKVDFGGLDADVLEIYDVAGVRLTVADVSGEAGASIDTSAWQSRIYLVRVQLADGNVASLKLGRK